MTSSPSLVYIDANPFIYFIEGEASLAVAIRELFAMFAARPGLAVTSELTLAEVLPKAAVPFRRAYLDLIIWSGASELRPVTRSVLVETAAYRRASLVRNADGSQSMVKLPDAIHAVTVIQGGCRRILSNDAGLRLPEGYRRVSPDHAGISSLVQELER